ncbi:hypothetical protein TNCV_3552111 [Trichonephila clavipes]|nr:hypothetical protein TNCV_3552111 [Trichonephila clavipes]
MLVVRMTSHNRLDDYSSWRVSRWQVGSCPDSSGGVSMVTSGPKVVSRLWNQFQTSGIVTKKVGQCRHRASASAMDRYSAGSARRHGRAMALQLARDLAAAYGRRISRQSIAVLQRLAFTPGVQSDIFL